MIKVEGLTKRYARHVAVDHISFEVAKGQIVGFLGPNGAGKTTTMRMLTCFMPPTEGTAEVAGFDVIQNPMEVKRRIGDDGARYFGPYHSATAVRAAPNCAVTSSGTSRRAIFSRSTVDPANFPKSS